jgi:hypothetical protein
MVKQINIRQILSLTTVVAILILFASLAEAQVLRNEAVSHDSSGGPVEGATFSGTLLAVNLDPGDFPQSPQQVPRIESTRGPRQRRDVTAYGADPTFTKDSTEAIQKAINAACDSSLLTGGGDIYFASGAYKVSQPQTPSYAPIFSIPKNCLNLHFVGENVPGRFEMPQFSNAPAASIVVIPGPSPNAAPMFLLESGQGSSTQGGGRNSSMDYLNLQCYNECVWLYAAGNFIFNRMNMAVANTGQADNTPLKISNSFWIYYYNGTLQGAPRTNLPVAIFVQDAIISGEVPVVGLVRFQDTVTAGGGFVVDMRTGASGISGNFVFDNVSMEMGGASGIAAILIKDETTGSNFGPLEVRNMGVSDNLPGFQPFLETQSIRLIDVTMINVQNSFASGPAIQMDNNPTTHQPGSIINCVIQGGWSSNRTAVAKSTRTPVAGCVTNNSVGWDFVGLQSTSNQRTDILTTGTNGGLAGRLPYGGATAGFAGNFGFPIRMAENGELNARIGIEPKLGLNYGPGGLRGGYDTRLQNNADQTLSLFFAQADPPTFSSLALMAGGSLTVAAHTYTVSSAITAANCITQTSAFLPQSITTTSGNQSVAVNWTIPTNTTSITGYCVTRDNATQFFVSGASTATFTDTGTGGSAAASPTFNATFPATPQFTWSPTGFGVNNPNPKFSLDVNGTAAVDSLNVSQHLNQAAANTFAGTIALVNGSATVAFRMPYKSAPVCVANDTSAIATVRVQTTTTKLTLSQSNGTDTIMYMCVGNPN